MYHPLQQKRGSLADREPPVRRVSSPDIKVNSVRRYPLASQQKDERGGKEGGGRGGAKSRAQSRVIVRRGSLQGRGSGEEYRHRSQNLAPRGSGEQGKTRDSASHGRQLHKTTHRQHRDSVGGSSTDQLRRRSTPGGLVVVAGGGGSQGSTGVPSSSAGGSSEGRSQSESQASWEEGGGRRITASKFRQASRQYNRDSHNFLFLNLHSCRRGFGTAAPNNVGLPCSFVSKASCVSASQEIFLCGV